MTTKSCAPRGFALAPWWRSATIPAIHLPGTLKIVEFIEKDSKRIPRSNGWGYAQFLYDAATDTLTEKGARSPRDRGPL
jgi:hypothetical protein